MKVLLADFDLFHAVGGGQTYYRSIIRRHPQIDFYYLAVQEPALAARPINAHPIAFRERYEPYFWNDYQDAVPPRWSLPAFLRANNIAASVSGLRFDVVDLPDYEQTGTFLRPALARHQVEVERVALSLHGRISTSIELNWGTEGRRNHQLVAQEDMQYQAVDLRYGLSRMYLDEWKRLFQFEQGFLSPLRFIDLPIPRRTRPSAGPPNLQFIGRTEKRKGPDLFVELAWWLPRGSYGRASIVGPENYDPHGVGSNHYLNSMANNRLGVGDVEFVPCMNHAELQALYARRAVTILPSRYDTFLLAATESLLAGCPTAIGTGAGVCRFLEETFPDVPFVKIDVNHPHTAVPALLEVLADYDNYRDRVVDALEAARPQVDGPSLEEIYRMAPSSDAAVRSELDEWYDRLSRHEPSTRSKIRRRYALLHSSARRIAKKVTTRDMRHRIRALHPRRVAQGAKEGIRRRVEATWLRDRVKVGLVTRKAASLADRYRGLHHAHECTAADVSAKIEYCAELLSHVRIDRVRLWREMARLESLRGNSLLSATYRIRAMRLAGVDRFHDLPATLCVLRREGFEREADAADAMYGGHLDAEHRCAQLLEEAFTSHRRIEAATDFESIDDRRDGVRARASIVVSLYDAADKLPMLLRALSAQTLLRARRAELVLVDSGSPGQEYSVFRRLADELALPAVYARTVERETIQTAWNRGIGLARGDYLTFLGVDEMLLPDALEALAAELDADPTLDWVQANSLVTNVSEQGHWLGDVMTYDRHGYTPCLPYLESCYLAYVGSMYRKDIHARLGGYDGSFRGAGDTEFKNRVLPFIKTKAIPRILGVFWNYPSDRATCGPLAELEDLRAWYLHRTLPGVRRALTARRGEEAEELLLAALRYRKSYCRHLSTDVEFACHVGQFLKERSAMLWSESFLSGLRTVLEMYRALDYLECVTPKALRSALNEAMRLGERIAAQQEDLCEARVRPVYGVFNDNRHEQHTQIWRAAA